MDKLQLATITRCWAYNAYTDDLLLLLHEFSRSLDTILSLCASMSDLNAAAIGRYTASGVSLSLR